MTKATDASVPLYGSGSYAIGERQDRFEPLDAPVPWRAAAALDDPGRDESAFPIVVHCHLRWDFVWQRPQQILSRLARHHRVLFIEDPLAGDGERAQLDLSEPVPGVVRLVPRLPRSAGERDVDAQWRLLRPLIEAALAEHPLLKDRFRAPVQWFYSPMPAPALLGAFGACGTVYDCMDELANFRFAAADLPERERQLLARADVVFTGGHELFRSKSRHHPTVYFHGCGVDVAHFAKAQAEATRVPEALAALPGPVFGYVGVIDERLDYALIESLARAFPRASVAMVGPLAKVEREDLPDLPNIHWFGQQPYERLPALIKGFDVCLMPFALNEATRYINPTKTLEYMAAGKPVVSTAVADVVRNFSAFVAVARSPAEFLDAVAQAARAPHAERLQAARAHAQGATWDATVDTMRRELLDAVVPVRAASVRRP
ncbi:glycosyltransferase [Luteimonas huabeiensis]|uniref:glycosyltransferase n=1 Tax=Luteimonas huabeiensis TaxID=1244513 RepID=UPI0004643476|nr:glycosyltransferase [Luteimonas huabeiensis]